MPSGEKGLDGRRLKDVRPRDLGGEDYSMESYKPRLQRLRLVELIGVEETEKYFTALQEWRKEWDRRGTSCL